jgi:membrane-bound lytic murein transglycosylase B
MLGLDRVLARTRAEEAMRGLVMFQVLVLSAMLSLSAMAQPAADSMNPGSAEEQFARQMAQEHGLEAEAVLKILHSARYQQSVIDTMTRPAEAKPWNDYRQIFVTTRRISDGATFYNDNRELLDRVAKQYGVPASMITAIIGVESNYGRTPMRYSVLDALVTLAFYYPPRQKYFRSELVQLLLLRSAAFPWDIRELTGSYAGAMGWPQFMPSSVAKYARDEDGDGKIDLWNSLPDICASIANYFEAFGWQPQGPVAVRAHVADNARAIEPRGLDPVYPLQQLAEWGYSTDAPLDPNTLATLIRIEGADGPEVWITFHNFRVISRYNKSPLYSLAAFQLSQAIAAATATP